ncbi:MAG: hypothetical protein L3K17_00065 [Thermoplasmata archaeon]|nr:hypothetical protein [Thermoplasmata archaeon]
MERASYSAILVALIMVAPGLGVGVGWAASSSAWAGALHAPRVAPSFGPAVGSPFAFVSNFEDKKLDGWAATNGTASVVTKPTFNGEPAIGSSAKLGVPQVDVANLTPGSRSLSFQAELYYGHDGTGYVGLNSPAGSVAVVGIVNGTSVYAGPNVAGAKFVEAIPIHTVQPKGWVEVMAEVFASGIGSTTTWQMDVYVDRTDLIAATGVSVPGAGNYTSAVIRTTHGVVDYSNLVFSSYEIPTNIPGYNNMEGYGQGSGLFVSVLPRYTTLSADLDLKNWSAPQYGILSIQVNAMNLIGTTTGTCSGFFQLGVDINPSGHIAPWYVPKGNCIAYYYNSNDTPTLSHGFLSPNSTHLSLQISQHGANSTISFTITDHQVTGANHSVEVWIPYNGSSFYGTYTQMEWQPCCSTHPINAYFLNASFTNLTISGGNLTTSMKLPASYMLPYELDAPPSWLLNYYQGTSAGYNELA